MGIAKRRMLTRRVLAALLAGTLVFGAVACSADDAELEDEIEQEFEEEEEELEEELEQEEDELEEELEQELEEELLD